MDCSEREVLIALQVVLVFVPGLTHAAADAVMLQIEVHGEDENQSER